MLALLRAKGPLVLALVLLVAAVVYAATRTRAGPPSGEVHASYRRCPVTPANGNSPDARERVAGWHGQHGIWLFLGEKSTIVAFRRAQPPPAGTLLGRALPDGSVYAKILWRRDQRARGRFGVTGRRLDGKAQPLRANVDTSPAASATAVPSSLIFPTPGCWRIDAKSGRARLSVAIRVVKLASSS
jgi:hypothetical protein